MYPFRDREAVKDIDFVLLVNSFRGWQSLVFSLDFLLDTLYLDLDDGLTWIWTVHGKAPYFVHVPLRMYVVYNGISCWIAGTPHLPLCNFILYSSWIVFLVPSGLLLGLVTVFLTFLLTIALENSGGLSSTRTCRSIGVTSSSMRMRYLSPRPRWTPFTETRKNDNPKIRNDV